VMFVAVFGRSGAGFAGSLVACPDASREPLTINATINHAVKTDIFMRPFQISGQTCFQQLNAALHETPRKISLKKTASPKKSRAR